MNLFWYKLKLTAFITFIIFLVIFLTGSSFFLTKYYKNYLAISHKLNNAKNKIIKSKHINNILNNLNNAQIAETLGNIVSIKNNNDNNITHKFLHVNYAKITNNYNEIIYQNFDNKECWINYQCINFRKDKFYFILAEKIDTLNYSLHNIIIFALFAFVISILLSFWIYSSVDLISKPVEKNIEFMKNFVNNAWHELKTPLANINLSSQILQKKGKYDKEIINDIIQESWKLSQLIDSLLNLSILNKNKVKQEINLETIINDILEKYKKEIEAKKIKINTQISMKSTYGDKHHFLILLKNLITNAIKYNQENGIINIKVKKWEIIVENTWNEISKEDRKKIFDIFYRINNIQEDWYGLGLAIVKKIAEVNKWKITVQSKNWINIFKIKL